jgi:hypothetical protein
MNLVRLAGQGARHSMTQRIVAEAFAAEQAEELQSLTVRAP